MITLPPSLQRERHSVFDECEFARGLSPEERLKVVALLAQDAVRLLAMNAQRERVLAARDPVPASTVAAWRRLHAEAMARATTEPAARHTTGAT